MRQGWSLWSIKPSATDCEASVNFQGKEFAQALAERARARVSVQVMLE
jgi:hypothetical protein